MSGHQYLDESVDGLSEKDFKAGVIKMLQSRWILLKQILKSQWGTRNYFKRK